MSREIKFRVYDDYNECYLDISDGINDGLLGISTDGDYIFYLEDGEVQRYKTCDDAVYNDDEGEVFKKYYRYIIEQSTGLVDKNGKEIYEGDIVGTYEYYYNEETGEGEPGELEPWGVIVYEPPSFGLWGEPIYGGEDRHFFEASNEMVVMGNIHENPELLGGERIMTPDELLKKKQDDIDGASSCSNSKHRAKLRYKLEGAVEMYQSTMGGEE